LYWTRKPSRDSKRSVACQIPSRKSPSHPPVSNGPANKYNIPPQTSELTLRRRRVPKEGPRMPKLAVSAFRWSLTILTRARQTRVSTVSFKFNYFLIRCVDQVAK